MIKVEKTERERERERDSSEKLKRNLSSLFYSYLTSTGVGSDKSWEKKQNLLYGCSKNNPHKR